MSKKETEFEILERSASHLRQNAIKGDLNGKPESDLINIIIQLSGRALNACDAYKAIQIGQTGLMNNFRYQLAQSENRLAYSEYNCASIRLERAKANERMAECLSQYEPLHTIGIEPEKASKLIGFIQSGRYEKPDQKQPSEEGQQ